MNEAEQLKTCSKCKKALPITRFPKFKRKRRNGRDAPEAQCHACWTKMKRNWDRSHRPWKRAADQRWRNANPEKVLRYYLRYRLKAHGLTLEDYDRVMEKQGGACRICRSKNPGNTSLRKGIFNIDHCHRTGRVRGFICQRCNHGIGGFKDNPEIMKKAIEYLRSSTLSGGDA